MSYASFKIRLLASLLDGVISLLLVAGLFYYVSLQRTLPQAVSATVLSLIILLNPFLMFFSILFTHYFGGSLGKLLTGLQVMSAEDKRLSFKRILFRQTIGYSFSWIFFGLGYLSVIKDEKKQAWHDKTVGSVVKSKNNMFIIGLMLYILLVIATISLVATSFKNFSGGPVMQEIEKLSIKTASPNPTDTKKSSCVQHGGKWLEEFSECESVTLDSYETVCQDNKGTFYRCESPCRHDPEAEYCMEVCMQVCKY